MSSFPFKTYYFATISDHLGKHKSIFREFKGDFVVSKLPEDHLDLRGGAHSQASAPLYLVLPRIGMILV